MPQSRKRSGAKAHRKRIEKVNQRRKAEQSAMQKLFNESIKKQVEDLKKKQESESASTEN